MRLQSVVMSLALLSAVATTQMLAQSPAPPPSQMLSAKELQSVGDKLLAKAKSVPEGIGYTVLLDRGAGGNEQLAVRVKSGQGEWHHDFVDVLICLEGEAQVLTGGSIINGKETAPGEIRGDGVKGGKLESFRTGDVLRIEAQVPHQFLVAPGKSVRYFAVKVKVQ